MDEAFQAECGRLATEVRGLGGAEFGRPTRCAPWTVAELLAHVRTATGRLTAMLAEPAPAAADVDAAGYYRPGLFGAEVNDARIDRARQDAAAVTGPALAEDFERTWRAVAARVTAEPPGRLVRTRHGDGMRLDHFLLTRVVEVGVHGLDLADALGRDPWLTEPAAAAIAALLGGPDVPAGLGWDRLTFIRKATGRLTLTGPERADIDRRGVRWLTLG
ncbi:MAG: hypothetical protein V7637_594 [Mycobacteriales bacterium]